MNFLEKDLEEIIYTTDKIFLEERGLESIYGCSKLVRQLRIGNYGISDLVQFKRPFYNPVIGFLCKGEITVYELKQNNLSISAFLQAVGYLHGIKRYLSKRGLDEYFNYKIVLIGKTIDLQSTITFLPSVISSFADSENDASIFSFEMYKYDYRFDGLHFEQVCDYSLVNEGF